MVYVGWLLLHCVLYVLVPGGEVQGVPLDRHGNRLTYPTNGQLRALRLAMEHATVHSLPASLSRARHVWHSRARRSTQPMLSTHLSVASAFDTGCDESGLLCGALSLAVLAALVWLDILPVSCRTATATVKVMSQPTRLVAHRSVSSLFRERSSPLSRTTSLCLLSQRRW